MVTFAVGMIVGVTAFLGAIAAIAWSATRRDGGPLDWGSGDENGEMAGGAVHEPGTGGIPRHHPACDAPAGDECSCGAEWAPPRTGGTFRPF